MLYFFYSNWISQWFFFCYQALKYRGYERLVLQVGRGSVLPHPQNFPHVTMEVFRFKDSIAKDMEQADLIISHAGKYKSPLVMSITWDRNAKMT